MKLKSRMKKVMPSRKQLVTRFSPQIITLEDRATPATFYVDTAFKGSNPGDVVTFNNGNPGSVSGLVFGTNAFATFNDGVAKANATAGDDILRIANGTYGVDNSAGPVDVTDSVSIIGSGNGATLLLPTSDASVNNGGLLTGSNSALIRISTAGKFMNVSDLIMDGGGFSQFTPATPGGIGSFLRYENGSSGTVNHVANIYDTTFDNVDALNEGAGIVVTDAGTNVNVTNSTFSEYGYVGVAYQLGSTGTVSGNTFSGTGAFQITQYGVTVAEGSNVLITGNTFRDHTGSITPDPNFPNDKITSAGVFVTSYDSVNDVFGANTKITAIGNTFTGNITGVIVGTADSLGNLDTNVTAVIQHNNIFGNDTGISTDTVVQVNALYNWWGNVSGPFASGNVTPAGDNPTGLGNPVGIETLWKDASKSPFATVLQSSTPILTATDAQNYRDQLPKATPTITKISASPTNGSPVKFQVTFSQPVSAFDLTDISITSTVGGTTTLLDSANNPVTATTRDTTYFVVVTGPTGTGSITLNVPASTVGGDTLPTIRTDLFGGTIAATPQTILFDNVAPTITASSPNGPLPLTATTSPAGFVVTFSEPVTGFTASDVVLGGTALRGNEVVTVTPTDLTGTAYNISIAGLSKRGTVTVAIAANSATDTAGNGNAAFSASPAINFVPPFSLGFAVGGDVGNPQPYFGVDENLSTRTGTTPFEANFTGGVRVASADFNNDGTLDVVVGSGVGRVAEIRIFDGATTKLLGARQVFENTFTLGVFVAAGDINGDGIPDIVVTPDQGGSSRTIVLDGKTFISSAGVNPTLIADFFAIEGDPNYRGGVRAGVGDVNADGKADIVVGAGFTGGPRIATFSGATLGVNGGPKLFGDYFAFSPSDAQTLRNGVFIAVGDINGDGYADITAGAGDGGGPRVQTYSGKALLSNTFTLLADFFAQTVNGNVSNRGGTRVAVKDMDGDGKLDLVVSPARTGGATIGIFYGKNPNLIPPAAVLPADKTLDLFGDFVDGVFVG